MNASPNNRVLNATPPRHHFDYGQGIDWPMWSAYAAGAALLAGAQIVRAALGLPFGEQVGIIFMVPAFIVAAFMGGLGPGLVTTLAGIAMASGGLNEPQATTIHATPLWRGAFLSAFLLGGGLTSVVCAKLRHARVQMRTEALLQSVTLASIGDAVITTDIQGRVTMMNAAAERLTGWAADEALDQDLSVVFRIRAADTHDLMTNPVSRVLSTGTIVGLANHTVLRTRDGAEIYIDDSAAPIRSPDGVLTGVVLVFRDCSERKHHEREVADQAERYMRLLEVAPDAILVNREGRMVLANAAAVRLFGAVSEAELINKTPLQLFHPDFHDFVRDRIGKLLAGIPVPMAEEKIVRLDGRVVDVDVVASPFIDRGQRSIHVVLRDISQRKLWERELRQWADAFTHCAHGIALSHPPTATVVVCNPAFARLLGRTVEDMAGASIWNLYAPSEHDFVRRQIEMAGTSGHARYETLMMRGDGTSFPVQMDLVTVHDGTGVLLYRVATMQDISERKAAEEEVRRLAANLEREVDERTAELRAANQELDAFTYAVSHDLRAPLRAMAGFSQALTEDYGAVLQGDGITYLEQIIHASKRMGALVEGLLVLSRTTRQEVRRETVDLTTLAERIRGELSRAEPLRKVAWTIAPGLAAHGDTRMLGIVLDNLLGNAWKYTAGTPDPAITFGVEHGPDGPVFVVSDNGAGFDQAHAGKLFQPFQRLHRQDEFPGIGIGLATVQRVISRHGGTISGEGVPGKGATFRFTLAPPRPPAEEFL